MVTRQSSDELAVPHVQRECPFCGSGDLTTTSKESPDAAYWRCRGCGQIWNPSRMEPAHRSGPFGGNRFRGI